MRVYISADIEGITGLVSWSQCSRPDGKSFDYAFARRMMTHDVNAAIRGARAGGATEILLKDSHGNSKNLLLDQLEPGVRLISGHGSGTDGMMQGIDETFDCAFLVGYHAMAGTLGGVMEHTITGGVHRLWVNGYECGEMGLSAGVAGRYGVPIVMVSSDTAGCDEASRLLLGVETAVTKTGIGRYMANMLSPDDTGMLIEAAAKRGVARRKEIAPKIWSEPAHIRVEFNRAEEADMGAKLLSVPTRTNGYTLEGTYPTYQEAHRVVWNLMAMSAEGIGSQY
ncbi:M55 family metallopeptidase [Fimbriimonas ginsengisoli]|uniref:Peptidase M55, D-aminopeptidase n=1 Tax=Fimbriimonas ginsengisoli Gsoil 348 TaxID=661478 RepID=A0A068NQJ5_FIMGI|nr:M55 family metallopeptidase [Fimbriimonas ginsengisoli]AIE85010.1 Peptidase M55, D-aminopeptidase [Fimbriimonas ginsengisoli Gsoil 348]